MKGQFKSIAGMIFLLLFVAAMVSQAGFHRVEIDPKSIPPECPSLQELFDKFEALKPADIAVATPPKNVWEQILQGIGGAISSITGTIGLVWNSIGVLGQILVFAFSSCGIIPLGLMLIIMLPFGITLIIMIIRLIRGGG